MSNLISKRGVVFLILFTMLALVGMQINFSQVVGSNNQYFTFFQFFGPIAGGFLGVFGVITILFAQLINFFITGKEITIINLLRLTPMLFAAYYFGSNKKAGFSDKFNLIVPILAMLLFWSHPVGQEAWFYALFWTIPIIAKFLPDNLFLRSLGATFTAHAVGGALWIWAVPMTSEQYLLLIPITTFERLLFASGIAFSYIVFTNILNMIDVVWDIKKFVNIEKRYVF